MSDHTPFDAVNRRGLPGAGGAIARPRPAEDRRLDDLYDSEPLLSPSDEHWDDQSLRRIGAMLWRRRWVILGTLATVLGATALFLKLTPTVYRSTAKLQVNSSPTSGSSDEDELPIVRQLLAANQPRSVTTQIEILRSDALQEDAMKRLQAKNANAYKVIQEYSRPEIEPIEDTDLIAVTVQGRHPYASPYLANAICEEYVEFSRKKNREQLNEATRFVQEQRQSTEDQLNRARTALQRYKERHNIFNVQLISQSFIERVGRLQSEYEQARANSAAQRAELETLRAEASRMAPSRTVPSEIVRSASVEARQAELTRLQLQLLALREEYTDTSPEVRAVQGQIASIRRQLQNEAQTEVRSWQNQINPIRQTLMQRISTLQGEIWANEARATAVQGSLAQARNALTQLPARERQLTQLAATVSTLEKSYDALSDQYQKLSISKGASVPSAQILFPAVEPASPLRPSTIRSLLIALLLGLPLAIGLAALVDSLDDRMYAAEDVRTVSTLPVLAQIPFIRNESHRQLRPNTTDDSPLLEKYRMLRTMLAFSNTGEPVRSIVLASARNNEGKSLNAVNLAIAAALGGDRVVLIDCDLREPSVHKLLGLSNEVGFTALATGSCSLADAVQDTDVPGLLVLTSGPLLPNSFKLLNSETARARLQEIMEQADLVIIDSPAALSRADAQVIATLADTVLIVVSSRQTGKRDVVQTRDLLAHTGIVPAGVILNKTAEGIIPEPATSVNTHTKLATTRDGIAKRSSRFFFG